MCLGCWRRSGPMSAVHRCGTRLDAAYLSTLFRSTVAESHGHHQFPTCLTIADEEGFAAASRLVWSKSTTAVACLPKAATWKSARAGWGSTHRLHRLNLFSSRRRPPGVIDDPTEGRRCAAASYVLYESVHFLRKFTVSSLGLHTSYVDAAQTPARLSSSACPHRD